MTKVEFIENMRANRGRLSSAGAVTAMEYIYDEATVNFVGYMMRTKKLGVEKASHLVLDLSKAEQNDLIAWIETQPATTNVSAIELKAYKIKEA